MANKLKKDRKSVFKELGLDDDFGEDCPSVAPTLHHPQSCSLGSGKEAGEITGRGSRRRGSKDKLEDEDDSSKREGEGSEQLPSAPPPQQSTVATSRPWYSKLSTTYRRPRMKTASSAPPPTVSGLQKLAMTALLIAVLLPAFSCSSGHEKIEISCAGAGPLIARDISPVNVCARWSQQVAQLNGTLYIYGGQAKSTPDQVTDTWTNNFLALDLTKSWDTRSPLLAGLPVPSGPPAVANGYLWNDYNNLFLYGGEFADNPYVSPTLPSVWKYAISSQTWAELQNPQTSAGNYSEPANIPVQRSAEGAGISVPELGLSWYFGGHLDLSTTPGWSNQIARVYIQSLLEFTHPGYVNSGVYALASGSGAGDTGAYRNITKGGVQAQGFPERADGVLVFVPGWGASGVLIGLAGGTNVTFTPDLSLLDVYDIAASQWYHQPTTGEAPSVRVNPCAVVASAPDASSFQIYLFGGQNLQPYDNQTQYDDMYILSIPAFTWIKVENAGQNIPAPRAGHTCTMRDGQIVLVGGYVGTSIPCDSPGIYVFNATSLQWTNRFVAGDHPADANADNSVLAASDGYQVPEQVCSVVGGSPHGGATATTPAAGAATGGPFATGKPPVFTLTGSGETATVTASGTGPDSPPGSGPDSKSSWSTPDAGLTAAAVVAGLLGVLAGYLGFCAWVYRRQVRAYRQHVAAANRYSGFSSDSLTADRATAGGFFPRGHTPHSRAQMRQVPGVASEDSYGWVGMPVEPRWLTDEASPGAGSGSGSGSGSGVSGGGGGRRSWEDPSRGDYGLLAAGRDGRGDDGASVSSTEQLLDGQEPSFFSVVMRPRRALRVVNVIGSIEQ